MRRRRRASHAPRAGHDTPWSATSSAPGPASSPGGGLDTARARGTTRRLCTGTKPLGITSSLVRTYCAQGDLEIAAQLVEESGDPAAAFHLARFVPTASSSHSFPYPDLSDPRPAGARVHVYLFSQTHLFPTQTGRLRRWTSTRTPFGSSAPRGGTATRLDWRVGAAWTTSSCTWRCSRRRR